MRRAKPAVAKTIFAYVSISASLSAMRIPNCGASGARLAYSNNPSNALDGSATSQRPAVVRIVVVTQAIASNSNAAFSPGLASVFGMTTPTHAATKSTMESIRATIVHHFQFGRTTISALRIRRLAAKTKTRSDSIPLYALAKKLKTKNPILLKAAALAQNRESVPDVRFMLWWSSLRSTRIA